jgi:hypothetical protein
VAWLVELIDRHDARTRARELRQLEGWRES